ncbi:MAG: hypothetical protein IPH03_01860 [Tetrasphaera sp.]|nr:hypothetical protein [Tetrasphaera sp.]
MSAVGAVRAVPPGWRTFARYAHSPNALGYCGPPVRTGVPGLVEVALGLPEGAQVDVPAIARAFSGAWPYQQLIADLSGNSDPLSPSVVRSYWSGGELTRRVDRTAFGKALLDRISPLAGHYWSHLTPDLLVEAAPTHLFHVIGVYPWSRLLPTGLPEPLQVIDSCRITPARVEAVDGERLRVVSRALRYAVGTGLSLAAEGESYVSWRVDGQPFADGIEGGSRRRRALGFALRRTHSTRAGRAGVVDRLAARG